ncbi:MAG: alpha/beta fold hydrolase [Porticoccus sp.]|nr:alpha/beta fold hydrolase [Porticoccus sp.]
MSKQGKKSAAQEQEELIAKAIEATIALNPLVGVSTEELRKVLKTTAKQAITQPKKLASNSKKLLSKVVDIVKGTDQFEEKRNDHRFDDPAWEENVLYHKLKQTYLAWDESMDELVEDLSLDAVDERRAKFFKEVVTSTLAPTNFLFSNPKAMRKVVETRGLSLLKGLRNYVADLKDNNAMPSQVDKSQFKVGENLATSKGAVVFRNDILELIQYKPLTSKVYKRPLLVIPPQINKFYIYDLTSEKSFFQFCLQEGFQVFVISWRNPSAKYRHWGMDQYIQAAAEAVEAVLAITRSESLNVVGACAGGITASVLSSYLKQSNKLKQVSKNVINSLSLSVCMLSMRSESMDLNAFTSPAALQAARAKSEEKGILEGAELAKVFSWMRPNDLVWNYHVNNYLMGEAPPAFDLLYWNNDSTNLPAQLHSDFLDLYDENLLYKGEMEVLGFKINLEKLDCDKYVTAGLTDHITPWTACYKTTQFVGGEIRFVLSSSGHIQSLVNPIANTKAKYFCAEDFPPLAEDWLEAAEQHQGSWWADWSMWLAERSGAKKTARKTLGNQTFKPQEDAPGTYVFNH